MVEDDSGGQDGGFEAVREAVGRAKREVGVAVGHGVDGVQHWVSERWLPVRLVLLGGFSWTMSKAFGWLLGRGVKFGIWLVSSLTGLSLSSVSVRQVLIAFFGVYAIHSASQTKLILDVKTNLSNMTTSTRPKVRTDGGDADGIWLPAGAIGGIIIGAAIGWSFGLEGIFVGAGLGWVLGDEYDKWFDEKFMGPISASQEDGQRSE